MFPLRDNVTLSRVPLVTIALVLANVVAYVLAIRHGGSFLGGPDASVTLRYGAIPYELTHPGDHCALALAGSPTGVLRETIACQGLPGSPHGPYPAQPPTGETLLTAMFLHASFLHIFGNMLFLAIFGPAVEDAAGRLGYLAFYLLGGVVALAAQVLSAPASTVPTLGASGAIAAVLGAHLLLHPRARVLTLVVLIFFFTIVEVPAALLLGFWFLEQLYLGLDGLSGPVSGGEGVAYFAHIGGFLFGLLTIRLLVAGRRPRTPRPVY